MTASEPGDRKKFITLAVKVNEMRQSKINKIVYDNLKFVFLSSVFIFPKVIFLVM